ncbi:hypothetical protein M427DRAFT_132669 [Gonapodya prolifera JEL478]|uniref:Uncharacterized protein n=1 Tax=Gonapodya prolifera (strain JEL478) TaxID=1344416 RepID=A0A139AQH4_GONPJ|nr:hypothetical protein M427DRAFT_132669 [Gonapodya prolifera JEL478]|eukprot:KXS18753.1 hypothetical protein M427DRAFT_132669 [Gonapodya prolifera JEL478]
MAAAGIPSTLVRIHPSDLVSLVSSVVMLGITQTEAMFDYPLLFSRYLPGAFNISPRAVELDAASFWHHNNRAEPKAWFQGFILAGLSTTIVSSAWGVYRRSTANRKSDAAQSGKQNTSVVVAGLDANDAVVAASVAAYVVAYSSILPAFVAVAEFQDAAYTIPVPSRAVEFALTVAKGHVVAYVCLCGIAGAKAWRIGQAVGWW